MIYLNVQPIKEIISDKSDEYKRIVSIIGSKSIYHTDYTDELVKKDDTITCNNKQYKIISIHLIQANFIEIPEIPTGYTVIVVLQNI